MIMSFEGIDNQIERYTKKINEITEKLKDPNLSQNAKKKMESELTISTQERTKWKIRKNNLFTTRHKK
jgi:phage-related tail protein